MPTAAWALTRHCCCCCCCYSNWLQAKGRAGRKRKQPAAAAAVEPEELGAGEGEEAGSSEAAAGAAQQQQQQQLEAGGGGEAAEPGPTEPAPAQEQQGQQRRFGVLPGRKLAAQLDMREDSMEAVLGYLEVRRLGGARWLAVVGVGWGGVGWGGVGWECFVCGESEAGAKQRLIWRWATGAGAKVAACWGRRAALRLRPLQLIPAAAPAAPALPLAGKREGAGLISCAMRESQRGGSYPGPSAPGPAPLPCPQSDAESWLRVLPGTAVSVRVSFYAATAQQLAPAHAVVQVRLRHSFRIPLHALLSTQRCPRLLVLARPEPLVLLPAACALPAPAPQSGELAGACRCLPALTGSPAWEPGAAAWRGLLPQAFPLARG